MDSEAVQASQPVEEVIEDGEKNEEDSGDDDDDNTVGDATGSVETKAE